MTTLSGLGTPIGSTTYVAAQTACRAEAEHALLDELPHLPDLQTAWLLLSFCASPRAQHLSADGPAVHHTKARSAIAGIPRNFLDYVARLCSWYTLFCSL